MLILLLSPVINNGLKVISKEKFQIVLTLILLYHVCSFTRFMHNGGSSLLGLLTIYLSGRYCNIFSYNISRNNAVFTFLICWILQVIMMFLCGHFMHDKIFSTLNYNTPFLMMMSISLFFIFKNMKPWYSYRMNYCFKPVLFIYLITEGLSVAFYKDIAAVINDNFIIGIMLFFLITIVCIFVGRIIMMLSNKLLNTLISYDKLNLLKNE